VELPIMGQTWTLAVGQGFDLPQQPDDDRYYYSSSLDFSTGIKLPLFVPVLGQVTYSPDVGVSTQYKLPGEKISYYRQGLVFNVDNSLKVGRADWVGNFRKGVEISITNSLPYNFEKRVFQNTATLSGYIQGFAAMDPFGIDSQFSWFMNYGIPGIARQDPLSTSVGGNMRGILDSRLEGDMGLFFNFDYEICFWKSWFPVEFFDFEFHLTPFFDYGVVRPFHGTLDFNKAWYSGGLELLVFPKITRSYSLRVSVGFDLQAIAADHHLNGPAPRDGAKRYELFIGLDRQY
jgi:hypothetical protein